MRTIILLLIRNTFMTVAGEEKAAGSIPSFARRPFGHELRAEWQESTICACLWIPAFPGMTTCV
jgi:hypothetical protein